jgi:hypothetical protein
MNYRNIRTLIGCLSESSLRTIRSRALVLMDRLGSENPRYSDLHYLEQLVLREIAHRAYTRTQGLMLTHLFGGSTHA